MTRAVPILALLTFSIVCMAYAIDAPLWVAAIIGAVALTPIGATILWDYLRPRFGGAKLL
jgi:hypothetical protein